jgi:putative ABC transport system ATP-binding protein
LFYLTYIYSELRRRAGRTLLTALGLAVGVGLVATVTALSNGLDEAQGKVLRPLTGVGTDMSVQRPIRVTGAGDNQSFRPGPGGNLSAKEQERLRKENGGVRFGLNGLGKAGEKFSRDNFVTTDLSFPESQADKVKTLTGVKAAAPGLTLNRLHVSGTVPQQTQQQASSLPGGPPGGPGGGAGRPDSIDFDQSTISGIDRTQPTLGLVTPSQISSGSYFRAGAKREAILATSYAQRKKLKVGSSIAIKNNSYKVVGLAKQPLGGESSDVYIRLGELQKLSGREGRVNVLRVRADSASSVGAVEKRIESTFAGSQVTTAKDLADKVSGSLIDAKEPLEQARDSARDRGARSGVPDRRAAHAVEREQARPRAWDAQGDRLAAAARRPPDHGRVCRPGSARRGSRRPARDRWCRFDLGARADARGDGCRGSGRPRRPARRVRPGAGRVWVERHHAERPGRRRAHPARDRLGAARRTRLGRDRGRARGAAAARGCPQERRVTAATSTNRDKDSTMMYRLNQVTQIYGKGASAVTAVDRVDLDVLEGEFLVIAGASGSGKTTLLQLLGGLDRPTSGDLFFERRNLANLGDGQLTELRQHTLGFIFQQFNLIPTLTARQNVEVAMAPTRVAKDARVDRAESLLESVGLAARSQHLPSMLSGGEQQRVAMARALANEPRVLLADEPTGNLDTRTGEEIVRLLKTLVEERNQTIILVTHDSGIAAQAPRVVRMRDGRLDEPSSSPHLAAAERGR